MTCPPPRDVRGVIVRVGHRAAERSTTWVYDEGFRYRAQGWCLPELVEMRRVSRSFGSSARCAMLRNDASGPSCREKKNGVGHFLRREKLVGCDAQRALL